MNKRIWAYKLRLMKRKPSQIPMDRLADYIRHFADLLGKDNKSALVGIVKQSTGLLAYVPEDRKPYIHQRIEQAKNEPESQPAKYLHKIEGLLSIDQISEAQLLDSSDNVVYLFRGASSQEDQTYRIYQSGSVDGVVTGVVGADDTMHLHLRDLFDNSLRLIIRDEVLARKLLLYFRAGILRLYVHGTWVRSDSGWIPETNKCSVERFEELEITPASEVFSQVAASPGNGWARMDDPLQFWKSIRGIE
jgi:hypothetical protein